MIVYNLILTINMLTWLGLILYYVIKRQFIAFHPASFYLVFHGLVMTIFPMIISFGNFEFMTLSGLSNADKIIGILSSLTIAMALCLARYFGYNPNREQLTFTMLFILSLVMLFILGYVFPSVAGAYFESLRTKSFWA